MQTGLSSDDRAFGDRVARIGLRGCAPTDSWHSDRTGERRWHIAIPMVLGAAGFALSMQFAGNTVVALLCLIVAASATLSATPPF